MAKKFRFSRFDSIAPVDHSNMPPTKEGFHYYAPGCVCSGTVSVDCPIRSHSEFAINRSYYERSSMNAGIANQKSAVRSGR